MQYGSARLCSSTRLHSSAHLRRQAELVRHVSLGGAPQQAAQRGLQQRQQAGASWGRQGRGRARQGGVRQEWELGHKQRESACSTMHPPASRPTLRVEARRPTLTHTAACLIWLLQHAQPPVAGGEGGGLKEGKQAEDVLQAAGYRRARHAPGPVG